MVRRQIRKSNPRALIDDGFPVHPKERIPRGGVVQVKADNLRRIQFHFRLVDDFVQCFKVDIVGELQKIRQHGDSTFLCILGDIMSEHGRLWGTDGSMGKRVGSGQESVPGSGLGSASSARKDVTTCGKKMQ